MPNLAYKRSIVSTMCTQDLCPRMKEIRLKHLVTFKIKVRQLEEHELFGLKNSGLILTEI